MADKEYIERGALIRLFDERYITAIVQQKHDDVPEDHKKHWKGVQSGTNWCKNTVLEAPAADVVEVVRCKDCIHSVQLLDRLMCKRTAHKSENGWFGLRATAGHHYCSYGERKDNGNA